MKSGPQYSCGIKESRMLHISLTPLYNDTGYIFTLFTMNLVYYESLIVRSLVTQSMAHMRHSFISHESIE